MSIHTNNYYYEFVCDYKHDDALRKSFNDLSTTCFDFSFESWYKAGYWTDSFLSYSLCLGGQIVASASINKMSFDFSGRIKKHIQIGTVMTHPDFRNRGLSRFLMQKILKEYEDKYDLIFLYANETGLDLYPKFRFVPATEYQYSKNMSPSGKYRHEKVNMNDSDHANHLINKIKNCRSHAEPSLCGDVGLVMFYLSSFMKDNVYYLEGLDAYIVAEINKSNFYLMDIFTNSSHDLDSLIDLIVPSHITSVTLGFTPLNTVGYTRKEFHNDNTTLFVKGKDSQKVIDDRTIFPLLAHT